VLATPSLNGKTLFGDRATMSLRCWISCGLGHVRISGLSRGWIWRTGLEMPEGISTFRRQRSAAPVAADLFR